MIYVDTSVVLADLLKEARRPPTSMWLQPLVSSQLLRYEVVVRLRARNYSPSQLAYADHVLRAIQLIDLNPLTLARAVEPFPVSVRTLDAMHLATIVYLRNEGSTATLATYDARLARAATAIGVPLAAV